METDDLSNELYKAIFVTAEKFHHDLTLRFGLLAKECKNEADYIVKAEKLINRFIKNSETVRAEIFFDLIPTKDQFEKALKSIKLNISVVGNIPIENRTYDF
jgi:hypothetical protein